MSSSASAKLVTTATRLFYERGIAATGVDTIMARSHNRLSGITRAGSNVI
jgi:AcrR family transcriptional regulator